MGWLPRIFLYFSIQPQLELGVLRCFLRSRNPNAVALNYSSNRPIANCIMDSHKNELSRKTMLAIHGLIHSWEQSKVKFEWLIQTNNRLVLDFL